MFNPQEVLAESSLPTIQEGWQSARISDVVRRTSQAGNVYVELTLEVEGGRVWERINIQHPKDNVRDIARRILANACIACGVNSIADENQPNELIFRECDVLLAKDNEGFFKVKQYRYPEGSASTSVPAPTAAPQPAQGTGFGEDPIPF